MAELTSTYIVQDRSSQEELNRLIIQDHMITTVMGGVLPEQQDPSKFRRVLDIGCGPGGWILEAAQKYPEIKKLYGIDISTTIVNHARQQAEQQNIPTGPTRQVEFLVMDALLMLEFPEDFFDLVNFRFGISFMRQWDWEKMFSEMNRVVRTNGIVRIVEGEVGPRSKSNALNEFYALVRRAMYRAGHLFKEEYAGLIDELPRLLLRNGFQNIQNRKRVIEYRTGTTTGDTFMNDIIILLRTIRPYLHRYGCVPKDYDAICRQATKDMQTPDFVVTNALYTLWATNPRETNGLGEILR